MMEKFQNLPLDRGTGIPLVGVLQSMEIEHGNPLLPQQLFDAVNIDAEAILDRARYRNPRN
jgi:hypothetical protein